MNSSGSGFNGGVRSSTTGASFGSYQFDFDLVGSARGSSFRPLKDQKPTAPYAAPSSATAPSMAHQPSRPSWTPAAAPSSARSGNLNAPTSMVGDIFGKSWASANPSSGIGIPKSDTNLFGDLVGSAFGQGRGVSANVPLKSAPPKNAFGVGNSSDSLPRSSATTTSASSAASSTPMRPSGWGSADKVGNYSSFSQPASKIVVPISTSGQPNLDHR